MSTSCTLKQALFPAGHFLGLQVGWCYVPVSGHSGWHCAGIAVCYVSLWAPSLPLWSFLFPHLQGGVLGPWVGLLRKSCVQETCTSQKNTIDGWTWGVFLCSFLSTSCWCVFSVTVCIKSSALLSAAINAASTDKSNKYLCALWAVPVYFLVLVFLS